MSGDNKNIFEPAVKPNKKINLRQLILVLAIASSLGSLANVFYASYQVLRTQLIHNALEVNYAYASKLAASIDDFIKSTQQQLRISAKILSSHFDDKVFVEQEATRLFQQASSFNSVVVANSKGKVLASAPASLDLTGVLLDSQTEMDATALREPRISKPYKAKTGNWLVFISYPVFSKNGAYLGLVSGTIYLKKESVLSRLLGSHFYVDGSYIFVVDRERKLIYHPDKDRIGTVIGERKLIDEVLKGHSGQAQDVNTAGLQVLAGYAAVPSTGWGVVTQRPRDQILSSLEELVIDVIKNALPIAVISLLVIWWCTRRICQPLHQLAEGARRMDNPDTGREIQNVRSWYYESSQLKRAMLVGIGLLQKNISKLTEASQTDPLTGLGNRRTLEIALDRWRMQETPFSIISADIDFFKTVNDTYGHDVGDKVLARLASIMKEMSRADDVVCRIGGEEFLILLPLTSLDKACQVAERLRLVVQDTIIEPVGYITISLGVAHWSKQVGDISLSLKIADDMLYQAKRNGRNRVEVQPVEPHQLADTSVG